jgi:hypothetical protein
VAKEVERVNPEKRPGCLLLVLRGKAAEPLVYDRIVEPAKKIADPFIAAAAQMTTAPSNSTRDGL